MGTLAPRAIRDPATATGGGDPLSGQESVKDRNFFRVLEFSLSKTPNCRRPTVSFPLSCISTELVLVMVRGEGARESLVCVCVSVKDPDYILTLTG